MSLGALKRIIDKIPVGTSRDNIAEIIKDGLYRDGYEIVERSSLKAMQEAVESRASLAAIGLVLEHAKKGDVIDGWPPLLSPPTGWRKESYTTLGTQLPGSAQDHAEPTVRARITKE